MKLNQSAVNHAKKLIKEGKIVQDSDWSERQPSAAKENKFLDEHNWQEYARWYLAEDSSEDKDNKEHYKFPYGDFNKVHRAGVIAAKQRAAQNDYHDVEEAADTLLNLIDKREGREK
jgi:hypothetical protein